MCVACIQGPENLFTSGSQQCYVQRKEYAIDILNAMEALDKEGATPKWGCGLQELERRNVFIGELSRVGIKKPDLIGKPSVRNDAAFLTTLVGVTSVIAVAAGQLPGDWGFFVPYLTGAIVLVVLAVGSTAPGLLAFVIGRFAQVFPDYRERVLRHEAAHFLVSHPQLDMLTIYMMLIFVSPKLAAKRRVPPLAELQQQHKTLSDRTLHLHANFCMIKCMFCTAFSDGRLAALGRQAGYLMRVPVTGYSLDIGKAHTDFAEAKLQQRLVERKLSDAEINQLAVVAMAGATAEAMNYDQACVGHI